jgi:hypothetical protein
VFEADGIASLDQSHLFAVNFVKCVAGQIRRKLFTFKLVRTDCVNKTAVAKWCIDVNDLVEHDQMEVSATVSSSLGAITLNALFRRAVTSHHSSSTEVRLINSQLNRTSSRGSAEFIHLISPFMNYFNDHEPEFIALVPKLFSTVILPILNRRRADSPLIVFQYLNLVDGSSNEKLETQVYLLATSIQLAKWCRKNIGTSETTRILMAQLSDSLVRISNLIRERFGEFTQDNALTKSAEVISWLIGIGRGRNTEIMFNGLLGLLAASHDRDLAAVLAQSLLVANSQIISIIGCTECHLLQKADQITRLVVQCTQAA